MGTYILTINEKSQEGQAFRKSLENNRLITIKPLVIKSLEKSLLEAQVNEPSLAKDWLSEEDNRWDDLLK